MALLDDSHQKNNFYFFVAATIFFFVLVISFVIAITFPPLFTTGWVWGTVQISYDIYSFFGFYFLLFLLSLGTRIEPVREVLFKKVYPIFTPFLILDFCLGEYLLILAYVALNASWFAFFFKTIQSYPGEPYSAHFARSFGHLNDLNVSLLILPVTRYSIWTSLFGIPFERVIKYHRVVARVALSSILTHMSVWWGTWIYQGTWIHNAILSDGYVAMCPYNVPDSGNSSSLCDWTIPYIEIAVLLVSVQVILSFQFFRRNLFELFYYSHHIIFPIFFVVANLHSWDLWHYLLPGIALYLFDKLLLRWGQTTVQLVPATSLQAKIVSVQIHPDHITQITVSVPQKSTICWSHVAGQYAFIHIPSISLFQSHPFTISSAPSESFLISKPDVNSEKLVTPDSEGLLDKDKQKYITFHIKNMGSSPDVNQFTSAVEKAAQNRFDDWGPLTITLEGPYGNPLGMKNFPINAPALLLIAGGIGVTPIHSIYREIYLQSRNPRVYQNGYFRNIRQVYVVWVVRSPAVFTVFPDLEDLLVPNDSDVKFKVHLFATDTTSHDNMVSPPLKECMKRKRPNMHALLDEIAEQYSLKEVEGFFCGPETMKVDLVKIAYSRNLKLHTETFLL